jgi:hypothetical protein
MEEAWGQARTLEERQIIEICSSRYISLRGRKAHHAGTDDASSRYRECEGEDSESRCLIDQLHFWR